MEGQAYTNHLGNAAEYSAQPNNVKDFFEDAISFNNTIGISSGGSKTQTYFSYSNRRVPYPPAEFDNNKQDIQIGVTLLGGPDKMSTRLWWDKP